jgi:nicotinate dehydrogenase subunit A
VTASGDTPLLYTLRNDLSLNGPKFGCGLAQCGACAVLMDGVEVRSYVTPIASVANGEITTSEGLGTPDRLHPLQAAFVDEQAAQCGYAPAAWSSPRPPCSGATRSPHWLRSKPFA